ncbi:MAG: polysaccharide biosynthesis tyrosine autokinase [Planctomycetota bacterium]
MTESVSDIVLTPPNRTVEFVRDDSTPAAGSLLAALSWRWPTMMVVGGIAAAISLTAVWRFIKPKYEVAATLHVAQVVKPVLFSDPETDLSRQFNVYLATQVQAVASPSVIQTALNMPETRSLALVTRSPDPVTAIGTRIMVEQLRGTELLKISMTGESPMELATIINTILRTYIRLQETKQRDWDEKILSSLRQEQAELSAKLDAKGIELRQLAVDYGSVEAVNTDAPMGASWMTELQRLITDATKNIAVASARIEALDNQGTTSSGTVMNEAEYEVFKQQDAQWLRLTEQLATEPLAGLADTQLVFGPKHPSKDARERRVQVLGESLANRESDLRDLFKINVRQKLNNQRQEAELTIQVLKREWDRLAKQREDAARQTVVLEDVRHERERLETALSQVRQKIWNVQVEQNRMARLTIDSPAVAPTSPNIDQRPKYAAAALVASLFLGVFAGLVRHRLDGSVRTAVEVTEVLGLPLLGTVNFLTEKNGAPLARDERLLDPIRTISTALIASSERRRSHWRLISSPAPGSGKSLLAAGLARSLASTGRRVLLVDADNHGQGVTHNANLMDRAGLRELLEGKARVEDVLCAGDVENLQILPAGKRFGQFSLILAQQRSAGILRAIFEKFDDVVVDSPPVLAGSTTVILATIVDEVVLVLRAGSSTKEHALAARRALATVGEKITGVILNGVDPKRSSYSYYSVARNGTGVA